MNFLILKTTNPYTNLAIEEYLFLNAEDDIFMLWQNEPTVVIGKNQNAFAELNIKYIQDNGINIARRITGGGAVYHDLGNINYTFISQKKKHDGIDFEYFTKPILEALSALGLSADLSGRNDILIDGKKISGNAQHSNGEKVLHHGTLLFDSDLSILSNALRVDEEKIKAKGIKSVRSRVMNIKEHLQSINVSDFIEIIASFLIKKYNPKIICPPSDTEIAKLVNKYTSEEWLFPEGNFLSQYTLSKKKRYPFGTVDVSLEMTNNIIRKIKIYGDFFGVKDINELEEKLENTSLDALEEKLSEIVINDFIFGMTHQDFLTQIK